VRSGLNKGHRRACNLDDLTATEAIEIADTLRAIVEQRTGTG
jgi:hypothetical protein